MLRLAIIALATASSLLIPTASWAQDRESARADFRAGVEALERDDLENAELLFRRSIARFPTTAARCNLALTLDRGGRFEEAIDAYRECAAHDSSSSGHYGNHANERAAELEAELRARREAPPPEPQAPPPPTPAPAEPTQTSTTPVLGPSRTADAEAQPVVSYRQQPPERSAGRAFLWLGLTSSILGAVAIVTAAALASSANEDADALANAGYPMDDGRYLIPMGDPGADTLASAESKSAAAVGFYVAGGVLGALGITLFVVQALTSGGSDDDATVAITPIEGGAAAAFRSAF